MNESCLIAHQKAAVRIAKNPLGQRKLAPWSCSYCGALLSEETGEGLGSGIIYRIVILGFLVFLLSASYYRGILGMKSGVPTFVTEPVQGQPYEKLPGSP